MKRYIKYLISVFTFFVLIMNVSAGSATLSVSKDKVAVGGTFTVTVNVKSAAAWNIHTSTTGPVSGCIINEADSTADAQDTNKTFTATCTSTAEGTIKITLSGDITSASDDNGSDISGVKTVISKNPSSNNNLSSIKMDNVNIDGFSSSVVTYNISVSKASVNVSATAADSTATVSGLGSKTLKYGNNKIEIKVTAENGSIKTYTLNINREDNRSTNNYLSSLTIDKGTINFNKDTTTYNVSVESSVDKVNVSATAADSTATVSGLGSKTLKYGNNKIEIKVTAENGSVKTYTLNINRANANKEQIIDTPEPIIDNTEPIVADDNDDRTYTLVFDSNGGSICSSITVSAGEKWGTLCTTTMNGHTFDGWYTALEGGEKITADSVAKSDLSVYAHWVKKNNNNRSNNLTIAMVSLAVILISIISILFILQKRKNEAM